MSKALYLASSAAITPIGDNVEKSFANMLSGISAYADSEFTSSSDEAGNNEVIKTAQVPGAYIDSINAEINEGAFYCALYDRILKLNIEALRQCYTSCELAVNIKNTVPLVLSLSESRQAINRDIPADLFYQNLPEHQSFPLLEKAIRILRMGRAGGVHAIGDAFRYIESFNVPFVLVAGIESYLDFQVIKELSKSNRLLTSSAMNAFVCGEGAGALLLTPHKQFARIENGHIIAVYEPGMSEEPHFLNSGKTSTGEALDTAFKNVLQEGDAIQTLYSTMNGERFWSKEFGVAMIRNKSYFIEDAQIHHPAEFFGDLGGASAPVFCALAAEELLQNPKLNQSMVYASSDGPYRGVILLNKEPV